MKLIQVTNCEQVGKFELPCQASNHEHCNAASGFFYKAGICEYGAGTFSFL
jgi:hypothetical protein